MSMASASGKYLCWDKYTENIWSATQRNENISTSAMSTYITRIFRKNDDVTKYLIRCIIIVSNV